MLHEDIVLVTRDFFQAILLAHNRKYVDWSVTAYKTAYIDCVLMC